MTATDVADDHGGDDRSLSDLIRYSAPVRLVRAWRAARRREREYRRWLREGRPLPPPHAAKAAVVREIAGRHGVRVMVETGTFRGDMVEACRSTFDEIHSIELAEELYDFCRKRLGAYEGVRLHLGDSARVLPTVLERLDRPALFWLDGHYSGAETALGDEVTPVLRELDHILEHGLAHAHVVLVDDARLFGRGGYPALEEVRERLEAVGHRVEVETDILRAEPPGPAGRP